MFGDIKDSLRSSITKSSDFLVGILTGIKNFFIDHKNELLSIREKIKDLYHTNLELGKYHLQNGRCWDTIIRLIILKRFIKDTPESSYIIAWAYLLSGNLKNALKYFDDAEMINRDYVERYLRNDDSTEILEQFIAEYKSLSPNHYLNQIHPYVCKELVLFSLESIQNLPRSLVVLDIAPNSGQIASEFRLRIPRECTIEGLDHTGKISMLPDNKHLYNGHTISNFMQFFESHLSVFSLVFTACGLNFAPDLKPYAQKLNDAMQQNGYFCGAFELNIDPDCIASKTWVNLSQQTIIDAFKNSEFLIVSYKELTFDKKNYLFIVTQKD